MVSRTVQFDQFLARNGVGRNSGRSPDSGKFPDSDDVLELFLDFSFLFLFNFCQFDPEMSEKVFLTFTNLQFYPCGNYFNYFQFIYFDLFIYFIINLFNFVN